MQPWQKNLYVLWLGDLLVAAAFSLVMPFLPLYLEELGVRQGVARLSGLILSSAFVATALASPLWGALADRFGQKPMLLRSGLSLGLIYVLMAFARDAGQLFLLRTLFGLLSGFIPASTALVASNTPREKLGTALGTLQTASAAGNILGPLLGGLLAHFVGIQGTFLVSGAALWLATALVLALVREEFRPSGVRQSILADLRQALAVPALRTVYGLLFCLQFGAMVIAPVFTLFVARIAPAAPEVATGLLFSLSGLAEIGAGPLSARVGQRLGYAQTLALGFGLAALFALPQAFARSFAQLAVLRTCLGFAFALTIVSGNVLMGLHSPAGFRGRAFGLLNSGNALAAVVASSLGGWVADLFDLGAVFLVAGGVAAAGLALAIGRRAELAPGRLAEGEACA
ncbi:MAG: MFS transporter [Bacillota bacterium]|nr:MFS transporter [Bacillota bacterium]